MQSRLIRIIRGNRIPKMDLCHLEIIRMGQVDKSIKIGLGPQAHRSQCMLSVETIRQCSKTSVLPTTIRGERNSEVLLQVILKPN
jgi:hypothetical protein